MEFEPTQPLAERVIRALRHRIRLLHRCDSTFFVLGATGNVYAVNLSSTPSCTCPDRTKPCKHILFVFIRVLGVPLDDSCLWRRTLRPCQLNRLLSLPASADTLAGSNVREMFHQLFFREGRPGGSAGEVEVGEGATCPVCLEEMGKLGEKIVACGTCRNPIHHECLMAWKKSSRRRSASCVLCRARWRNPAAEQDKYLNLSAYISEEDDMVDQDQPRCR
ncbi:OLC1v1029068C1 [Oldenlandia corymbosa var. corymbosa]|uniref:OLC1v1029068C1 n=1 Tax=Oldenlandia corymbosa var. corymbosa TaxID=529605 RepID=A0AAV1CG17_OLDCO|nr:OLC1v1029068C1 [Oldenlandia corymbosa var. corymbosa]